MVEFRTGTKAREIFQKYHLVDLVEIFKSGIIVFAATQQFPVFGWESMTQEEVYNEVRTLLLKI